MVDLRWPYHPNDYLPARAPVGSFWRAGYPATRTNPDGRHFAIDIAGPRGARLVAVARSTVYMVDHSPGGAEGRSVVLLTGSGLLVAYFHLDTITGRVVRGNTLVAGSVIGTEGISGNTRGAHLHLEIAQLRSRRLAYWSQRDPRIDPYPFILEGWKRARS
jgi:murein DD-endopeptidase MepM/ murein hydrolase activator NlpD